MTQRTMWKSQVRRYKDVRPVALVVAVFKSLPGGRRHIVNNVTFDLRRQVSSTAQGGIFALGKVRIRSSWALRGFPNVAFETVPMLICITMALSRPSKEDRRALPLSTLLSSHTIMATNISFQASRTAERTAVTGWSLDNQVSKGHYRLYNFNPI